MVQILVIEVDQEALVCNHQKGYRIKSQPQTQKNYYLIHVIDPTHWKRI